MAKFVKGQSGNPAGRPADPYGLQEYARSKCKGAIDAIESIYNDPSTRDDVRLKAADIMLDRGIGSVPKSILPIGDGRVPGTFDNMPQLPADRVQIERYVQNQINKDV